MAPESKGKVFVFTGQPSEDVQGFLTENSGASWQDCLNFVLSHYPQTTNSRVNYLVEGGVAVKLLFPQRPNPEDLDIVTSSKRMVTAFQNSHKFDVKLLSDWYAFRLYPYNTNAFKFAPGKFLLDLHESVRFEDREVLILNRAALAVSKILRYANRDPREKDIQDLQLLNPNPTEVRSIIERITSYAMK